VDSSNQYLIRIYKIINYYDDNLSDEESNEKMENLQQNVLKFAKRHIQAKAKLAGLWGVPTKYG
jgi:hypothetical protein